MKKNLRLKLYAVAVAFPGFFFFSVGGVFSESVHFIEIRRVNDLEGDGSALAASLDTPHCGIVYV